MIYLIIWAHCFADFFMQTHEQATKKSSSNYWLTRHVLSYIYNFFGCLALYAVFFRSTLFVGSAIVYVLVNGLAHFATDYVTSRITSKFWKEQKVHEFFATIGVDQALHMTVLIATIPLLKG